MAGANDSDSAVPAKEPRRVVFVVCEDANPLDVAVTGDPASTTEMPASARRVLPSE